MLGDYFDPINEYGDPDAMSCAAGDYNAWEDSQVFADDEGSYIEYDFFD